MATLTNANQLIKFLSKNWQSRSGKEFGMLKGIHKNPQVASNLVINSKLFSLGHEPIKQAFLHLGL